MHYNNYPLTIGARDEGSNRRNSNGVINEVRIYNRILSESEIKELFESMCLIDANIDLDPDTLNLKSKGKWMAAYIELPDEYSVSNINITTVKLHHGNNEVSASWGNVQGDIYMVKFSRSLVQSMLNGLIGDV